MSQFQEDMKLAQKRYCLQGIVCRPMTPEEAKEHDRKSIPPIQEPLIQLPFKVRVKQMKEVRSVARRRKCRIIDACDEVGITFANYRSIKAAHTKGLTKRP